MSFKERFAALKISGVEYKSGQIWRLKDVGVLFPERDPKTIPEGKPRLVIILQNGRDCQDPLYPCVTAAPITSKIDRITKQCYKVAAGEGNLHEDSLVKLGFIQPILKSTLERKIGEVSDDVLQDIKDMLLANLGLLEELNEASEESELLS